MIRCVVRHSAAATDVQYTVRGQSPHGIITACTAGNHRRAGCSCFVSYAVLLGIALGVGVFSHRQGHTLRCVQEDIRSYANNTIRDIQILQARIALEHIFTHAGQLTVRTDLHTGQLGAEIEGITIQPGYAVGDGDLRQTTVTKGTPADLLQLAAFLKAHALQLTAPVEVELADISNVLTDDNLANLLLMCFPRSPIRNVIHHCAGTVNNQLAVAIQNIIGRLAAQPSVDYVGRCTANKLSIFKHALFVVDYIGSLIG